MNVGGHILKKLDAFPLKIIALFVMLLDHLWFGFPNVFPVGFHPLSRFVAPLFAYFMVEGLFYTKDRVRYNLRLFGWAIFMESGNVLLNTILVSKEVSVHNNIFMTLAVGLLMLNLAEFSKHQVGISKIPSIVGAVLCTFAGIFTEGGFQLMPFIWMTYLLRDKSNWKYISYMMWGIFLFFFDGYVPHETAKMTLDMLMFNSDFLVFTVIPFIMIYSGNRGKNTKFSKYLFYVFYPLHLWGIAIVEFILK
jgi:hypothetical protein